MRASTEAASAARDEDQGCRNVPVVKSWKAASKISIEAASHSCTGQAWAADEAGSASARLEPAQQRARRRLLEVGAGEQGMVAHQCP